MKISITYLLIIFGLINTNLPASAINLDQLETHKNISNSPNYLLLTQASSGNNSLNKDQLKEYLTQYKQAKKCQIKGKPQQKKQGNFIKYLFDCVGYNFEVIPNQQNNSPITALVIKSYPVLILQQGNRYKVKFSTESRITVPRPIIVWTKNGADEFADQFSQQKRATIVTNKFNQHFINNGDIKIPPLSLGILNGQSVVCAASSGNCRSENVLWTLKKNNQQSNVIRQLNNSLIGNAATPLLENQDSACVIDNSEIQTNSDFVDMSLLTKKIVTDEIQCPQNQEHPEKIASQLESSDNFDAIRSDTPPVIAKTVSPPATSTNTINPVTPNNNETPIISDNNSENLENCWEKWDCEPDFEDLDPEFVGNDWESF